MTLIFGCKISKGDISGPINDFTKLSILAKLLLAQKRPKFGIQLPNAGCDNQSCRIFTVLFNRIEQLQNMKYNIYSSTLFYTNVSISTALRGGAQDTPPQEVNICVPRVIRRRM